MKRVLSTLILLLSIVSASAQKLTIESFSLDASDITASSQQRLDGNGEPCALVKVQLAAPGATFDGNLVGDVAYKVNQYWVYMTSGSKRLQVNHPHYLPLDISFADYGINSVKGKMTYVLTLALPDKIIVERTQDLVIKVTPQDAIILIDGDVVQTTNGQARIIGLPLGNHSFNATKFGYTKQQGEIKLTADAPGKLVIELDRNNAVAAQPANNVITQPQQVTQVQTPVQPVSQNSSFLSSNAQTFTVKGVSFTMIPVEGGTFTMGTTSEQGSDADSDEKPTHSVTLSSYMIGETEVTQALWEAVMGSNPSRFKGTTKPVEQVSWNDCQTFISKLNSLTGKRFRLPTEAEWEYACRGGNKSKGYKYSGSNNIDDVAVYTKNSYDKGSSSPDYGTHAVKTKRPNELGIYDMSGNVWEWCSDWKGSYSSSSQTNPTGAASGARRVLRGGSWYYNARGCRSSGRGDITPGYSDYDLGLRLVLSE